MLALIRLYPPSPIILCDFDYAARKLDYHNLYIVQPTRVIEERGKYSVDMLFTAHNEMLRNTDIVFSCPFNMSFNMFITSTGEGFTLPLWPGSEVQMVRFYNPFPKTVLKQEKFYAYEMIIPTEYIHPQVETFPAYKIYFPDSNVCFDGTQYWVPESPPKELPSMPVRDYYIKGLSTA